MTNITPIYKIRKIYNEISDNAAIAIMQFYGISEVKLGEIENKDGSTEVAYLTLNGEYTEMDYSNYWE